MVGTRGDVPLVGREGELAVLREAVTSAAGLTWSALMVRYLPPLFRPSTLRQ